MIGFPVFVFKHFPS